VSSKLNKTPYARDSTAWLSSTPYTSTSQRTSSACTGSFGLSSPWPRQPTTRSMLASGTRVAGYSARTIVPAAAWSRCDGSVVTSASSASSCGADAPMS
jgi:hypothetical protein